MNDDLVSKDDYDLDDQVGYLLRLANQRHATIFQRLTVEGLTPMQFSALLRISQHGAASQNQLGRLAAMDVATVKGVVDRLRTKGFIASKTDPNDARRSLITLTPKGAELIDALKSVGAEISAETLAPLSQDEQRLLVGLLRKLS